MDVEDFDPSLAVMDRVNDGRHVQAASIHAGLTIPASSGLAYGKESGSATSWELRMDITVTHSNNATYFKTVGWQDTLEFNRHRPRDMFRQARIFSSVCGTPTQTTTEMQTVVFPAIPM